MVESHTIGMGVLMVLLPLVGGCLSASEERSSQAGVPVTTGQPVAHPFRDVKAIVHLSDGRVVDAARYPGELPVLTQRYVANRHTWEPTVGITRTGAAFYTSIDWDSFYG